MARKIKSFDYNDTFPRRLRELIDESKGITQEKIAEVVGATRQTVGNWCSGKSAPDAIALSKIAREFNVSIDWLLQENAPKQVNATLASVCRYTGLTEDACKCLNRDGKQPFFRDIVSSFISSYGMLSLAQSVALCRQHLREGAVQAGVICAAAKERKVIDTAAVIQKLKMADASYKAERYDATNVVFEFVNEQISVEKSEYEKYLKQSGYASVLDLFTTDLEENRERLKELVKIIGESESAGDPDGEHPETDK